MNEKNKFDEILGHELRDLREKKKITQKQLGGMVGITAQQVGKYERAENTMSIKTLHDFATAMNKPVRHFVEKLPRRSAK